MQRYQRLGRKSWTALLSGIFVAGAAMAQQPTPQLHFDIPGLSKTPGAASAPRPGPPAMPPAQWWTDTKITQALELTEAQRKDLADTAESILGSRSVIQVRQIEARKQFELALSARDWSAARKAAADWNQTLADAWGVENTLKIELLSKLDAKQHQKLFTDYPHLLRRPWAGAAGQSSQLMAAPSAEAPPAP